MSLVPGTRLGPYIVASKLGEGGMGVLYRGTDTRLGREVAIKVLPVTAAVSPDALARFEREGRAIASLNHPNICTLFDVGTDGGQPYLVMELLSGASLHQVLAAGPLPAGTLVEHAIALADALHAAHARGIVHRDLKPANVFLTEQGAIKILDFGLAKADSDAVHDAPTIEAALTGPGTTLGTLSYMSPEQLRGAVVDGRSDLFRLAWCSTRWRPGDARSRQDARGGVRRDPARRAAPAAQSASGTPHGAERDHPQAAREGSRPAVSVGSRPPRRPETPAPR